FSGKKRTENGNGSNHYPRTINPTYPSYVPYEGNMLMMELDNVNIGKGKGKKLSQGERQKLMASGACFHCKRPGHTAKFCPSKGQTGRQQYPFPMQQMQYPMGMYPARPV